ncbi:MAG TPA: hypothetical protein PKE30_17500, partial [Niabella sp.]|nr:hypothetical protein [Niabella sp.]
MYRQKKCIKQWVLLLMIVFFNGSSVLAQHIITFCGVPVPMDPQFVPDKPINVIKKQENVVNLPSLRQ